MANLTINDGGIVINSRNIASADLRYGPYSSVGEARSATMGVEAEGLTVGVHEDGEIVEYWYRLIPDESTGLVVLDLVRKTQEFKTLNGESIIGDGDIPVTFANGTDIFEVGIDETPNLDNESNIVTSRGIALAIKNLQDQIIEISKDVFPLRVEFDSSLNSPVTFTGDDLVTTLTWRAKIGKIPVAPDMVIIKQDGEVIYELNQTAEPPYEHGTKTEDTCIATISKYGTTVFSIEATAKGMTQICEIPIMVVLPSYVGFYSDEQAELVMMRPSLMSETIDEISDLNGDYICSTPAPAYLTIAVPYDDFTVTEVTSGGFIVPLMVQGDHGEYEKEDSSIRVDGRPVKYKIYRSLNKIIQGLMTIKVE